MRPLGSTTQFSLFQSAKFKRAFVLSTLVFRVLYDISITIITVLMWLNIAISPVFLPLRIPDSYDAKIAKICNFWTFWPVIQPINHLFNIITIRYQVSLTDRQEWKCIALFNGKNDSTMSIWIIAIGILRNNHENKHND